jgi:hypothetical protein
MSINRVPAEAAPPTRLPHTLNDPYRRAIIAACRAVNATHDHYDATYVAMVLARPEMEIFGLDVHHPGQAWLLAKEIRHYRASAKRRRGDA